MPHFNVTWSSEDIFKGDLKIFFLGDLIFKGVAATT